MLPVVTSCLPRTGHNVLLCSSDVAVPHPDKKSVIMYVTSLFQVLPQSISMEAIKEVETLPRAAAASIARVTTEEHYEIQTQQRFSQQVRHTRCRNHVTSLWLGVFGFLKSQFHDKRKRPSLVSHTMFLKRKMGRNDWLLICNHGDEAHTRAHF